MQLFLLLRVDIINVELQVAVIINLELQVAQIAKQIEFTRKVFDSESLTNLRLSTLIYCLYNLRLSNKGRLFYLRLIVYKLTKLIRYRGVTGN